MTRLPLTQALRLLPGVVALLLRLRWLHPRRDLADLVAAATPAQTGLGADRAYAAARVARAVIRRLPWLFRQPCLYGSLAGYHYLRRAGVPAIIHIGVQSVAGEVDSHAWLTVAGAPLPGQRLPAGYQEVMTFGDQQSA